MANPTITPYQEGKTSPNYSRADMIRRDVDEVTVPKVTLYDIDYAVYHHLVNSLKLQVVENDTSIPVPVMFATGEKWSQIRQHGYLRDSARKLLSPVITIRRTSMAADGRIPMYNSNQGKPTYKLFPQKTRSMQWDRTEGQYLKKDSVEYYLVDFPDYVRVSYELMIWTDLQEQMNHIVHSINNTNDHVWGDVNTFRTNIQDVTHDNVNVPGEDRLIKTTITLQVDGYLRSEYKYQTNKVQKQHSIKTVRFLEEGSEKVIFDATDEYPTRNNRLDITTQNKDTIKEELSQLRKTIRR